MRFLSDYLARPRLEGDGFPGKSFERERGMALDAARSLIDDRTSYAYERAIETACEGEPMAIPDYGGIKALEGLDRVAPEAARRDFLSCGAAWIVAAGALPDDGLGERIEEFLAGLPERAPEPVPKPVEVAERASRRRVDRVELQQSKLVLVFRMPDADPETWVGRRLFVSMFGGGAHSRLFREVREKRSLAYYASAACDRHKGLLTVQIGLDEARAEDAEAESLAQLADLAAGNFEPRELDTARAGMLSAITSVDDSIVRRSEFTSEQWILGVDRTPDELFAQYREADRELVLRGAAGAWLDTSYLLAPREERAT